MLLELFSIPSSLATTEKVDPKKLGYFCWNTLCKTKISDKHGPKERGLLLMCILLTRIISIIHDIQVKVLVLTISYAFSTITKEFDINHVPLENKKCQI